MSKRRYIVTHTGNFAVKPAKIVFDSRYKCKFENELEAHDYYEGLDLEDSETRIYLLSPEITNMEFVRLINLSIEIAAPGSSYYTDAGTRARSTLKKIGELSGIANTAVEKLIEGYYKSILEDESFFKPAPKYPIRRGTK